MWASGQSNMHKIKTLLTFTDQSSIIFRLIKWIKFHWQMCEDTAMRGRETETEGILCPSYFSDNDQNLGRIIGRIGV